MELVCERHSNGDSIHGTHLGIGIDGIDGMGIHMIIIGIDHLETEVVLDMFGTIIEEITETSHIT